jgi:ribosomal protein S18 acetylase RimI-like enzyme
MYNIILDTDKVPHKDCYYFLLRINEVVVGKCSFFINIESQASIQYFYLKPEFRQKGHGRKLYVIFEDIIRQHSKTVILSAVSESIGFCTKMGYIFTGEREYVFYGMNKNL